MKSADELKNMLEPAKNCVINAARLTQNVAQSFDMGTLEKKDRSPVTMADYGAQAIICRGLVDTFGPTPIIAEEDAGSLTQSENKALLEQITHHVSHIKPDIDAAQVVEAINLGRTTEQADAFWTLDPIDGTKGFLRRQQYAISLAYIENAQLRLSVVACPNLLLPDMETESPGCLFTAIAGQGAFVHSIANGKTIRQVFCNTTQDLSRAILTESYESSHTAQDASSAVAESLGMTTAPLRIDSQAKYAAVACGLADVYLRLPVKAGYVEKIWDHAGGVLLVQEAGGKVTDVSGKDLQFVHGATLASNDGAIVTNGKVHDTVLQRVSQFWEPPTS